MNFPIEAIYCLACDFYEKFCEKQRKPEEPPPKYVHYYFAYGSTMNQQSLEEKIGRVQFVSKATLYGFQLNFAGPNLCLARATLIPNHKSFAEGAVYKITEVQLAKLDQAKLGKDYDESLRLRVLVEKDLHYAPIPVQLHVLDPRHVIFFHAPSTHYLLKMIKGAEQIEVSEKYLKMIKQYAASIQRAKL